MTTRRGIILAVGSLTLALLLLPVRATAWRERSVPQDERDDLHNLVTSALSAAREADQAKLEEIACNLMIPDYESWFSATFGEELGAKLAAAYSTNFERDEKWLPRLFEWLAK